MAILNVQADQIGQVGVKPGIWLIQTNDTIATVTTAGYLTAAYSAGNSFNDGDMAGVITKLTPSSSDVSSGWYQIHSAAGGAWSLTPMTAPGTVVLPTIANHMAIFTNTTGTIGEDVSTAINGGNLQAGLSGTAGYLSSFPATAARGSLRLVGANSAGDTVTQITNASQAAARVYSIPDGGQAASSFLLTDGIATQTIATGSLALTLGNITAAAGNISASLGSVAAGTTVTAGTGVTATTGNVTASAGNVVAGASGAAGTLISFPATAANGSLIISALNAGGAFNTTISNSVMGQASVVSIPDPGAATANFMLSTSAGGQTIAGGLTLSSGNLAVNAGSISSGLSAGGFVGLIQAYPTTATSGLIGMQAAINATGNFGSLISNSTAQAQAQVVTIPDCGAATANFILSSSVAAAQTISSGLSITGGNNVQITGGGNFLAGASGAAGAVYSYPAAVTSGTLGLAAVTNATGDFDTTISNASAVAQDQVITIPDSGAATAVFDVSPSLSAAVAPKAIVRTITAGFAALAAAGQVVVQASTSGTCQFAVIDVKVMYGAAGLSGGGGDRLLSLTDGTIVFNQAGITAALLGTPVYTVFGGTGNPLPGSVSTTSTAGAAIYLVYTGGATDYTAGSVTIQVTLAQVTL